jgi:PKD domain
MAVIGATLHAGVAHAVPVANFDWSPKAPLTHQRLTFVSTSTPNPDPIVSLQWDFDEDDVYDEATGATATWTFTRPGPHTVGLRVTDSLGGTDTQHIRVVIGNRTPVPSVVTLPVAPAPGQQVTLLSNSYDPDGFISAFGWDIDNDGAFDDGSSSSVSTTFPAGRRRIALLVTDDSGDTASTTAFVEVGGAGVSASGALLSPFPIVRVSGIVRNRGIKVRLLSVTGPVGVTVHVRCSGRGCPLKRTSTVVERGRRSGSSLPAGSGLVRIKRFRNRLLRTGVIVRIFVVKQGAVGKYTRLRIRKGKPPARVDRCVTSVNSRPFPCP